MRIRDGKHSVAISNVDRIVCMEKVLWTIDEKILHETVDTGIFILSQNVAEYGGADGRWLKREGKDKRINVEQKCVSIIVLAMERRNMFRYLLWLIVGNAILLFLHFHAHGTSERFASHAQSLHFTSLAGWVFNTFVRLSKLMIYFYFHSRTEFNFQRKD